MLRRLYQIWQRYLYWSIGSKSNFLFNFFNHALCRYIPLRYCSPSIKVWPCESLIIFSQITFSSIFTNYIGSDELTEIKAANEGISIDVHAYEYSSSFVSTSSCHHSSLISAVDFLLGRCPGFFSGRSLLFAFAKTITQSSFLHLEVGITIVNQLRQIDFLKYYFFINIRLHCII